MGRRSSGGGGSLDSRCRSALSRFYGDQFFEQVLDIGYCGGNRFQVSFNGHFKSPSLSVAKAATVPSLQQQNTLSSDFEKYFVLLQNHGYSGPITTGVNHDEH
jgi:hypothetical protein